MAGRDDYSGMTVNERLVAAGLLDVFDQAVLRRDRKVVVEILSLVDVPTPELTAGAIFADPSRYGYPHDRSST
jgi:hypothetical protein